MLLNNVGKTYEFLDEECLNILNRNGMKRVSDFLSVDPEKIISILKSMFLAQDVLHPKQVIWYIYIFFIRQLFVYFLAPDVPNSHHKDFLNLVFLPFYQL